MGRVHGIRSPTGSSADWLRYGHGPVSVRPLSGYGSTTVRLRFDHGSVTVGPQFGYGSATVRLRFGHRSTTVRPPFQHRSTCVQPLFGLGLASGGTGRVLTYTIDPALLLFRLTEITGLQLGRMTIGRLPRISTDL